MMDINRRSMLQQALLLVGAAVVPGSVEALAAATKTDKPQLSAPRFATLTALADTIVPKTESPGAVEVGVPKMVDALLGTWASPERRVALTEALDRIDSAAKAQKGKSFVALKPAERLAFLVPYDSAALKALPPEAASPPTTVPLGKASTTVDPQVGRTKEQRPKSVQDLFSPRATDAGYAKLKELIVIGYYTTEAALTTELRYEHNPGAWEPSLPITPDTRPWGGFALI